MFNRNAHILLDKLPDVKQVFFRVNYGRQYQRTYSAQDLQKTVVSWDTYAQFIDGISRDINASLQIDEYDAMRNLFTDGVAKGIVPLYHIDALATENDAKTILSFADSSTQTSSSPAKIIPLGTSQILGTQLKHGLSPDNISILLTSQATAVIDVQALASAFNLDYANFIGKRQTVDYLDNARNIKAIMFDDFAIMLLMLSTRRVKFTTPQLQNSMYSRNKQSIMALNPFANMVAFTTNTFTGNRAISPMTGKVLSVNTMQSQRQVTYTAINGANTTYQTDTYYVIG